MCVATRVAVQCVAVRVAVRVAVCCSVMISGRPPLPGSNSVAGKLARMKDCP